MPSACRSRSRSRSGRIRVQQIEPGELSPGEFSHRVRADVDERGARVVLIDSINGYLHAIPQSDSPLARMHELLSYLNERGVATLIVLAQHGIVGTSMQTPLDVSYLADTVMMLRFFESQGRVRRAISVLKKRSHVHETDDPRTAARPGAVHSRQRADGLRGRPHRRAALRRRRRGPPEQWTLSRRPISGC